MAKDEGNGHNLMPKRPNYTKRGENAGGQGLNLFFSQQHKYERTKSLLMR